LIENQLTGNNQQSKNINLYHMPFKPATRNLFNILERRYYTKTKSWEGRCFAAATTNSQAAPWWQFKAGGTNGVHR
jgi:hypothetical protein